MDKEMSLNVFNYKGCFLLFTFNLHNKTFTEATLFSGEANNLEIRRKASLLIYWRVQRDLLGIKRDNPRPHHKKNQDKTS